MYFEFPLKIAESSAYITESSVRSKLEQKAGIHSNPSPLSNCVSLPLNLLLPIPQASNQPK